MSGDAGCAHTHPLLMNLPVRCFRRLLVLLMLPATLAVAAPFTPSADTQVLESLPTRASDPRAREMRELGFVDIEIAPLPTENDRPAPEFETRIVARRAASR